MNKEERFLYINKELQKLYPKTPIPLDHDSLYTLLVAVLLSAQCTDVRVNQVTPKLFALADNPFDMSKVKTSEIKKIKLVGIGGNINKIFKLSGNKYGKPLSRSKFKSTLKKLKKTSRKKMLLDLKLNPDRIDVILPAGKIYYFLMKTLSIEKIYVPKIGLADGMVKKIINSKIKF